MSYEEAATAFANRDRLTVTAGDRSALAPSALAARIEAQAGLVVNILTLPDDPAASVHVRFARDPATRERPPAVYADPYDGAVLGPVRLEGAFTTVRGPAPLAPAPRRLQGVGPHHHGRVRAGAPGLSGDRPLSALAQNSSLADLAEAEPVPTGPSAVVVPPCRGGNVAPAGLPRDGADGADVVLPILQGCRHVAAGGRPGRGEADARRRPQQGRPRGAGRRIRAGRPSTAPGRRSGPARDARRAPRS